MKQPLLLSILVASLTLSATSAPVREAHACGDEVSPDTAQLRALANRHYAALRARDASAVTSLWNPASTYTFDHRGCCPPSPFPARSMLLSSLNEPRSVVVETIDAPIVRGDVASITATVRIGAERFNEYLTARRVRGAWVFATITRARA